MIENKWIEEAVKYADMGLTAVPVEQKAIRIERWTEITTSEWLGGKYDWQWSNATGVGLVCGKQTGIIALDVDLIIKDNPELIKRIEEKLPPIFCGKKGNPQKRPTQFFQYNGEPARKFNNIHVEILSTGNQTVIPPSIHPVTRAPYEWVGKRLEEIDTTDLPILPDGLIEFLEKLNEEMRQPDGDKDLSLTEERGRCKHGSHNKISYYAMAMFRDNYPFDRLLNRIIKYDKKINFNQDYYYFNCPSRKWRTKSIEENAKDFLEEIWKNHGPGSKNNPIVSQPQEPPQIIDEPKAEIKPPPGELNLMSLKDLLEKPDEDVQYVVADLLPSGGTSIVAAKPKCGKTTLLRQLALNVARGEMFLLRMCAKGPVIYLSVEEKIDEIKAHFKDMGADGSEEIYIFAERAPKDTLEKLKPIIEKIKPSLIILDTLFKIIRMKDANDYAAISTALEPIQELARQSGAHIMCVHHAGKAERDGADGILGSTAILAAFDTAIIMSRANDKRTIKTIQRYGEDMEEAVLIFDRDSRCSSLGQQKWKAKADERDAEVLGFIKSIGRRVDFADVKSATGMDKILLRKTLKSLADRKAICVFGDGTRGNPFSYSFLRM